MGHAPTFFYRADGRNRCRPLLTAALLRAVRSTRGGPFRPHSKARLRAPLAVGPRMMNVMVVAVVVAMMRRIRQRHVCQQHHRDRNSDNLAHDIPKLQKRNLPRRIG